MAALDTIELKVFLPSKDFELSARFYQELGFAQEPLGPDLAAFSLGPSKFLLQKYYLKEFAESLQMHLLVHDVDSWWQHANQVVPRYGLAMDILRNQPWGLRDFTFHDPAGVCWRVGQEMG